MFFQLTYSKMCGIGNNNNTEWPRLMEYQKKLPSLGSYGTRLRFMQYNPSSGNIFLLSHSTAFNIIKIFIEPTCVCARKAKESCKQYMTLCLLNSG